MSQSQMKLDTKLPSFATATEWLNRTTAEPRETETKGRPTLVHFWSLGSETSKTNLAQVAQLRDQRKREGLRVVAIHSPQSEAEKDPRAVREAVARLNVSEPCALDNAHRLRDAFVNGAEELPAYYLFDIDGNLRGSAAGANGLDTIEDQLDQLLAELRAEHPFCPACELFLNKEAMFCAGCGLPLNLPGKGAAHPYYENQYQASLPTVRLFDVDPLVGHMIDGKYELVAKLGEGGMSVVYRARRAHIGDDVAVKILLGKFVKDDAALTRFRREARAAAMLRHPNVITIHDFGETDDDHAPAYIVMEFVRGTPLRELLKSENHLSVERAVRLMRGICAGVSAAHRQGVVHRDLKPENILVVAPDDDFEFESVRVVDFGLAKLLADAGAGPAGTVVGTPHYMSPEQGMGEPLDTRSDVYSLGAMFYEMLSGKRPFDGDTVSGVINRHLYEPPPPLPASLNIPRRLASGIMQALSKDPDERPQTAGDLARLLL
ncbi:MAG TPA: protein kinase [Pyrinomonadaceae bacterium]|jgi:predicted Ser/Thr protein kinase|nr:protein kinase [Pyrinomonadaceae bacterium]